MLFGITVGDSSGIGPEILLKAWRSGEIRHPVVAYGDREVLDYYNSRFGYSVPVTTIADPAERRDGALCVIDSGIMKAGDVTVGQLNAKSGRAARAYVIAAARAALAGRISAMTTLPVNKEATRLSDPKFVGHTELIGKSAASRTSPSCWFPNS